MGPTVVGPTNYVMGPAVVGPTATLLVLERDARLLVLVQFVCPVVGVKGYWYSRTVTSQTNGQPQYGR
jgi:hypothetical protein